MKPISLEAHRLMAEGALALADAEHAGIHLDVPYLKKTRKRLCNQQVERKDAILETPEGRIATKLFGKTFATSNNNQIGKILLKAGHKLPKTEKGNVRTNDAALLSINTEFTRQLKQIKKYDKIIGTYIDGWMKEVDEYGYMHPNFNLHTAVTYRSSSSNPNFQNIPRRDKESNKLLRSSIIPSPGNRLVEFDYGSMEVRIISCYTKDPMLLEFLNTGGDMHYSAASWFFGIPEKQVSKDIRDIAKSKIVFPEFYGSYWKSCARSVWKESEGISLADGSAFRKHLRNESYTQELVKKGEKIFWKKYKATRDWQDTWNADYQKLGYFEMLTGHRCQGAMSRNDMYNYPVQGTAFLCLVWAIIEVNKWLRENNMKSYIIGQIHDSICMDIHPDEFDEVVNMVNYIMTTKIREKWSWLIAPLLAEADVCEVDASWYTKTAMEL